MTYHLYLGSSSSSALFKLFSQSSTARLCPLVHENFCCGGKGLRMQQFQIGGVKYWRRITVQ